LGCWACSDRTKNYLGFCDNSLRRLAFIEHSAKCVEIIGLTRGPIPNPLHERKPLRTRTYLLSRKELESVPSLGRVAPRVDVLKVRDERLDAQRRSLGVQEASDEQAQALVARVEAPKWFVIPKCGGRQRMESAEHATDGSISACRFEPSLHQPF
jgi:hypothetical protein